MRVLRIHKSFRTNRPPNNLYYLSLGHQKQRDKVLTKYDRNIINYVKRENEKCVRRLDKIVDFISFNTFYAENPLENHNIIFS